MMDKNTRLYYNAARALNLPCQLENDVNGFSIFLANRRYYVRDANPPFNLSSSVGVAINKYCVHLLLRKANIPVPDAIALTKKEFIKMDSMLEQLPFPVVAKPTVGTASGKGVFCNIKDAETLRAYLTKMYKKYGCMSIEAFQANLRSYRVLVFQRKVIGVVERIPAHVFGDGIHTLRELIDITNAKRALLKKVLAFGPIEMAEEQFEKLRDMKMTLDDIPPKAQRVFLAHKCNSGMGGTMRAADDEICPENRALAIRAAEVLELELIGLDVLCEDIAKPICATRGFIIEANYIPDVTIHENTVEGEKNCVTQKIMFALIKRHPFAYAWHLIKINRSALSFYLKLFFIALFLIFLYRIA